MDETILDLAQLFSSPKDRALPKDGWTPAPDAGDTLIVHEDYQVKTEPPLRYKFEDIVSFVTYWDDNAKPEKGMIFYTNENIVGLLDRYKPMGNKVHYNFELSPELLAWKMARNFSHKKFKKFLEERLDELTDTTIFNSLAVLKMNTSIYFQSDFDDERNYAFTYEEKEGKGSSKIPKELTIKVPFFANSPPEEIPLRLSVSQPKDPDSKPLFTIEIIREEKLLADNVAGLIAGLKETLPDHMILHGEI